MTPGIISKPYTDVVDEWLSWQRQTNRPMPLADYAKFMDAREGAPLRQSAYDPNTVQGIGRAISASNIDLTGMPASVGPGAVVAPTTQAPQANQVPIRAGDVTGEMGASVGSFLDMLQPEEPIQATNYGSIAGPIGGAPTTPAPGGPTFAEVGRAVGQTLPEMATTAPLLMAGWPGLAAGAIKTGIEAYTPQADPVAGIAAPLGLVAGAAAVPAGARAAGNVALRGMFPSMDDLVQQAPRVYGRSAQKMLETAIDPAAKRALQAAQIGGGVAAGTGVAELQRQGESLARTGELAPISGPVLAADVASNLVFAPALAKVAGDPYKAMQIHASETLQSAQTARNRAADVRGQRGSRVGEAHKMLLDALDRGESPDAAMQYAREQFNEAGKMDVSNDKAKYDELQLAMQKLGPAKMSTPEFQALWQQSEDIKNRYGGMPPGSEPTPDVGLRTLKQFSEEAEGGLLPDEAFHRIVAGVQGRFTDMFKNDPTGTPYGTIEELVQRGYLPKISKQWIEQNFGDAVDMMLGDYQGAKANLINRIYAHYQERLPGALEQMRRAPLAQGLSRQTLNAQTEADKDQAYMNALVQLFPHMKTATVDVTNAEGKTVKKRLADALWEQDVKLSSATQGGQLSAESTAWARFDAWKNAVIRLAETYDPVTRQGLWVPAKRMADGEYLELPAQPLSLEDMTKEEFLSKLVPTRKLGRGKSASRGDPLTDALEFVNDKFRKPDAQVEEDIQNIEDPEQFAKDRAEMVRKNEPEFSDEWLTKRLNEEADALELTPEEKAQYVEAMRNEPRAFGLDLTATNKESYYDIALHLMNKVQRTDNAILWQKYGGDRLFGKGAKSPGKFELFKDALLARMESEMDDTGQLTAAQKTFYENWRKSADTKLGTEAPLAKTWKEQRAQFRHALRLYWAKGSVSMPDLFMSLLDDKPQYQQMLKAGKRQAIEQSLLESDGQGGYVVDTPRLLPSAFKGITLAQDGTFPAQSLTNLLKRIGVSDEELGYYNDLGMSELKDSNGRIKYRQLKDFIERHAPKAEVKKLEVRNSAGEDIKAQIEHLFETKGYEISSVYGDEIGLINKATGDLVEFNELPNELQRHARDYEQVVINQTEIPTTDAATGRYGVEPKDLKDMPGAVDILVRVPTTKSRYEATSGGRKAMLNPKEVLFRGPHFGNSDVNVLASVRGYVETLPSGEKVFHVFEVQSDWGQERAKINKGQDQEGYGFRSDRAPAHPLLENYEYLALRAAIDHARSLGIKKVAISDAETAMMTEGHDRGAYPDLGEDQIPQRFGMRAAYDERLPRTMEKLTGKRGEPVNFGLNGRARNTDASDLAGASPVFKKPNGQMKNDVTARLYDISSIHARSQESTSPESFGTIEPEKADYLVGMRTPTIDALRLFKGYAQKLGLNESVANEYAIIAAKAVQTFNEVEGVGKLVGTPGVMGVNLGGDKTTGPVVAINLDMIKAKDLPEVTRAVMGLQTMAHELAHNYSSNNAEVDFQNSGYKQQRVDAYAKLAAFWESLGVETSNYVLNTVLPTIFYPPQFRPPNGISLTHGDFTQEATSRLMEHVLLGLLTRDHLMPNTNHASSFGQIGWLPDEIQSFTNFAFRDVSMMGGAIEQFLKISGRKDAAEMWKHISAAANEYALTNSEQQRTYRALAQGLLANLDAMGAQGWQDPALITTALRLDEKMVKEYTSGDRKMSYSIPQDVYKEAQQMMFGEKLVTEDMRRLGTTTPPWSRYAGLFYQAMRRYQRAGVPLAENAMRIINDLEPAYFRLTRRMHEPFMTLDKQGRLIYDPDHPVQLILQNRTSEAVSARKALNELYLWQNEHGTPVSRRNSAGQLELTQEGGPVAKQKLGRFAPNIQQGVLEGLDALVRAHKNAAELIYNAQVENTAVRVAGIFMTADRSLVWDTAFRQAQEATMLTIGYQNAQNQLALAQKEPLLAQQMQQQLVAIQQQFGQFMMGLTPQMQGVVRDYLMSRVNPDGTKIPGMAQKLLDLDGFFKKRGDWFGSETRPGRYFIMSKMPPDGEMHYTSAPNEPAARRLAKELAAQGHTDFRYIDRNNKEDIQMFAQPESVVNDFMKVETKAWEDFIANLEQQLSPQDMEFLKALGYTPGEASAKRIQNKALERYMQPRELKPGRELLDAFEVFRDYSSRISGSIARRGLRGQIDLMLRDPRVRNEGQFKATVNDAMQALMTPVDDRFVAARAGMTAYFLGLPNVVSPIMEGIQSISTILPYLVDEQGFSAATKTFASALTKPAEYRLAKDSIEFKRLMQAAKDKAVTDPKKMTKEEAMAYYYHQANDEGVFQYGPIYSATLSRDHQLLTQQAFGLGKSTPKTREQLITDPLYWAAQKTMWAYSHLSAHNARVGMVAALDFLYDRGLRGNDLYQAAAAYKNLATFGGGKANAIGFTNKLSNPTTRSAFSLIETLQRYTFGYTTMFKDFTADMLGRTGLTPRERVRAAEALSTATLAQFLLAGALGIPGMAIGAAVIKKLSGDKVDPKQKLREFWVHISKQLGADDELAVTIANYAQNGVVSNALGVDVSNRLSTNSLLGFNSYDGFNTNELFGVGSSIIEGLIEGTKAVAKGDMVKAGKSIAPPSWRPFIDLTESQTKYGNFALRDQSRRQIMPLTGGEAATYALGLRPHRYRLFRDAQEAVKTATSAYNTTRDSELDGLAQDLMNGNTQSMLSYIQELRANDPTANPQTVARAVIDRAVAMQRPIDLQAQVPTGATQEVQRIMESFGDIGPRQSEVQDLIMREQLNARTGFMAGQPADAKAFERAALIDALVKQQGITRTQAVRLVETMGY